VQRGAGFGRETPADSGEPPFSLRAGKRWARVEASIGAEPAACKPNTSGDAGPRPCVRE